MKIGSISFITGLACSTIILNMISLSNAIDKKETMRTAEQFCWADANSNLVFKPVSDECPNLEVIVTL